MFQTAPLIVKLQPLQKLQFKTINYIRGAFHALVKLNGQYFSAESKNLLTFFIEAFSVSFSEREREREMYLIYHTCIFINDDR